MNDQQEIAAAITLNVQLGAARTLQLSTYLPRDADAATYNAVLDKLATAADRQEEQQEHRQHGLRPGAGRTG